MDTLQFYVGFFVVLYILVFLVDYFIINKRKYNLMFNKPKTTKGKKKTKKKDIKEFGEINYLVGKFNLDKKKIDYKSTILWTAIINAFIISFVSTVISAIPAHTVWQLLVGFVLIFALIYALYEIYGRILVKKGWGKNE